MLLFCIVVLLHKNCMCQSRCRQLNIYRNKKKHISFNSKIHIIYIWYQIHTYISHLYLFEKKLHSNFARFKNLSYTVQREKLDQCLSDALATARGGDELVHIHNRVSVLVINISVYYVAILPTVYHVTERSCIYLYYLTIKCSNLIQ